MFSSMMGKTMDNIPRIELNRLRMLSNDEDVILAMEDIQKVS